MGMAVWDLNWLVTQHVMEVTIGITQNNVTDIFINKGNMSVVIISTLSGLPVRVPEVLLITMLDKSPRSKGEI